MKRHILVILMACLGGWGHAAVLKSIHPVNQPGKVTLFLTIQGSFSHHALLLSKPHRLALDLQNTRLQTSLSQINFSSSLIQSVRSGISQNKLRLVFDLKRPIAIKSSLWPGQGLRLELIEKRNQAPSKNTRVALPPKLSLPHLPQEKQATLDKKKPIVIAPTHAKRLRDVVVVLDAGHGGKDPGARGPNNTREKNVVLAITLRLKQLIEKQPGMRAVLTRSGDYYVGLRERLDIARKCGGDLFVSIHADAFNNPHSSGASVYALSQRGATSEAARWIAEKENYSELGGVNLGDLDDTNGVVRSVLIDLSQTATINSSLNMGTLVLRNLNHLTHLHHNKVEQAGFMVLKSTDIPSILVETGFISNPSEERNLISAAYQIRLSQAIFQGIKQYFMENPPRGTKLEVWG